MRDLIFKNVLRCCRLLVDFSLDKAQQFAHLNKYICSKNFNVVLPVLDSYLTLLNPLIMNTYLLSTCYITSFLSGAMAGRYKLITNYNSCLQKLLTKLGKHTWKSIYNKVFRGDGPMIRAIWIKNEKITVIHTTAGRLLAGT